MYTLIDMLQEELAIDQCLSVLISGVFKCDLRNLVGGGGDGDDGIVVGDTIGDGGGGRYMYIP